MNRDMTKHIDTVMIYLREEKVISCVKDRFWDLMNLLDFSIMEGFAHCLHNVICFGDNWWMTFDGYTTEGQLKLIVEILDLIDGWGFMIVAEAPLKEHGETNRWHIIKAENNT